MLRYGDFGLAPSGGGKYFAETLQGARDFAAQPMNAAKDTIMSVAVPRSFVNENGYFFNDPGGAGASIHFSDDALYETYKVMRQPQFEVYPQIPDLGLSC
jgi:hypothetical protein